MGDISKLLYGDDESIDIEYSEGLKNALRETKDLIDRDYKSPIFEATFQYDGVLVRVDVLIPVPDGWRAIEVKASTSVKDVHVIDCAIQLWVMKNCGLSINSISLGYVNNQFVCGGNDNYEGLLIEEELTKDAQKMEAEVVRLIADARAAVVGAMPDIQVGTHCSSPYRCDFEKYCWPAKAEYPVMGLRGSKAKLASWVNDGYEDIRDVPGSQIGSGTQQRIHRVTQAGAAEVLPDGREILSSLPYPRYYLDFETVGPAVPIWVGTRPYQTIPVQFSVHVDDGSKDGSAESMLHREFLDLSGSPPMRPLAEQLIEDLGNTGPVLMYTSYEKTAINALIDLFPDLSVPLQAIIDRLFDLHPVVRDNYYHPDMLGSWSIKSVLPALLPHMHYDDLEGIKEGMGASEGYLEAISSETTPERRDELEEQLLRYCKFDTEAMVEIVQFFTR